MKTLSTLCIAVLFFCSCAKTVRPPGQQKTDLQIVADAFEKTAVAVSLIQDAEQAASSAVPPLLSVNAARAVNGITLRVSLAQKEAIKATREIAKLDGPKKAELLAVITPVITAIGTALADNEIVTIRDAKTRDTIRASLLAAQMALSVVQVVITR